MTTPQSGREAFEALAISFDRYANMAHDRGDAVAREAWASAARETRKAALAQQGREVGEPDGYTSYGEFRWAADCDERMRREWLPLYTAAPKQQAVEVGEAWQVRVFPVAVNGEDDAHRVEMKRGVQSFWVGPDYWNTREDAEAYAGQLRIALAAPKQQAVEVTEEMVANAVDAYAVASGIEPEEADIRAALLAALPGKTEVTP